MKKDYHKNSWASFQGEIAEYAKDDEEFHDMVCARDGYTCQACKRPFGAGCYFENGKNTHVCAHHVVTKGSHPELRLKTGIGRCVCNRCHNMIHNGQIKL